MLGQNSRQDLWVSVQTQLGTLSRKSWLCCNIGASFFVVRLCCCFVTTYFFMLLSRSVCRHKVVKCRNIYAAPMSSAFVASLLRQCGLTFFFDDCHNKAVKCRDKLSLSSSLFVSRQTFLCHDMLSSFFHLFYRDNHFYVTTFFQCFLRNSSNPLSQHIFECRDNALLSFTFFFVATKLLNIAKNVFCLLHIICHDKAVKSRDILSAVFCLNCVAKKLGNVTTRLLLLP